MSRTRPPSCHALSSLLRTPRRRRPYDIHPLLQDIPDRKIEPNPGVPSYALDNLPTACQSAQHSSLTCHKGTIQRNRDHRYETTI